MLRVNDGLLKYIPIRSSLQLDGLIVTVGRRIVCVGEMESPSSDNTEQLLSNYRVKFGKTKMI